MAKKEYIGILLVAAAVLGAFMFVKPKPTMQPPKNTTVVAFGDSLISGYGATKGNDMISVVSRMAGVPIINEGKSGDTTTAATDRLQDVLAHNPGVVILLIGGNDYLRRVPIDTTFRNIAHILTTFQDNDIRVILLGVRGGLLTDTFSERFDAVAQEYDVPYITNVLEGILGERDLMFDAIHPNDAGYALIAERVAPVLLNVLGLE